MKDLLLQKANEIQEEMKELISIRDELRSQLADLEVRMHQLSGGMQAVKELLSRCPADPTSEPQNQEQP